MDDIMNWVAWGSLVLAVIAFFRSNSAMKIAKKVLSRVTREADANQIKEVIDLLSRAKDAASRRRFGAPSHLSAGITKAADLDLIQQAQDVLLTGLPAGLEKSVQTSAKGAAEQLEKAFLTINNPAANRDGWADARATLQNIIPELNIEAKKLFDAAVLDTS